MPDSWSVRTVLKASGPARILVASNAITVLGDTMLTLVLVIWVKELTGNSGAAGGILAALQIPGLLSLLGGHFMDSLPSRLAMLTASMTSALALLLLFLVRNAGQLWIVYLATMLYGTGMFLYQGARAAATARLVAPEGRAAIISVLRSSRQVVTILAPSAGALILEVAGHRVAITTAVLILLVSSGLSMLLKGGGGTAALSERGGLLAGMSRIWRTAVLRRLTSAMMVYLTVAGFFQVAVIAAVADLGAPAALLGPVATVQGTGSIAGALLAPYLARRLPEPRLVAAGLAAEVSGAAVMAALSLPTIFTGAFLVGIGLPILLVGSDTAIMNRTPLHLQGRASMAVEVITSLPLTASFALASAAVNALGPVLLMITMAVVTGISVPIAYMSDSGSRRARANS